MGLFETSCLLLGLGVHAGVLTGRWLLRALSQVRVGESSHPVVKMGDGRRMAVWPVWDWSEGCVVAFQKARGPWGRVADASLQECNQYRRALGECELPFDIMIPDRSQQSVSSYHPDEEQRDAFERAVDEEAVVLDLAYRKRAARFWRRTAPAGLSACLVAAVAGRVALGALMSVPPSWGGSVAVLTALLGSALLWLVEVPVRPSRADAHLAAVGAHYRAWCALREDGRARARHEA
jgi:hypothetical protein